MPRTLLTIGPVHTLVINEIYALPARACYIFFQGTAPTISNDGSVFAALPANNVVAAAFIRSAAADTILELKAT
jgi:hypothetical protein